MKFEHLRRNSKIETLATKPQINFLIQLVEKYSNVFLDEYEEKFDYKKLTKKDAAKHISKLRELLGDDIE